ncbi:MAG TPA: hypothetical protein DEP05_09300 [Betaproteobacteria bacterium]|nr:hypothetical protein [Betaproteobacteria bacterium]
MGCKHSNPPGYAFCASCGEPLAHRRCRCGFVCADNDSFCGQCGAALANTHSAQKKGSAQIEDADHRFDLQQLMELAAQENQYVETQKARVTQDDIRKLLAKRKKRVS